MPAVSAPLMLRLLLNWPLLIMKMSLSADTLPAMVVVLPPAWPLLTMLTSAKSEITAAVDWMSSGPFTVMLASKSRVSTTVL